MSLETSLTGQVLWIIVWYKDRNLGETVFLTTKDSCGQFLEVVIYARKFQNINHSITILYHLRYVIHYFDRGRLSETQHVRSKHFILPLILVSLSNLSHCILLHDRHWQVGKLSAMYKDHNSHFHHLPFLSTGLHYFAL